MDHISNLDMNYTINRESFQKSYKLNQTFLTTLQAHLNFNNTKKIQQEDIF